MNKMPKSKSADETGGPLVSFTFVEKKIIFTILKFDSCELYPLGQVAKNRNEV